MIRLAGNTTHKQTVASAEWTIEHSIVGKPIVGVSINYQGRLMGVLPLEVEHTDANTVKVRFSSPQTGEARLS